MSGKHGDPTARAAMDSIRQENKRLHKRLMTARRLIDECMEDLRRR